MIEIGLNRVRKNFGFRNVLDGASMEIHTGERAAIVGPNGAGKSTILRLIAGDEAPDAGEVSLRRGARMGVLWQIPPLRAPGVTVEQVLLEPFAGLISMERRMRELESELGRAGDDGLMEEYSALQERYALEGGYETEERRSKVIGGFRLSPLLSREYNALSGGQKTVVNLAAAVLPGPDILLLDEPTNHLDLHATEWLEEYIRGFRGTVVAISHDRYFLDRVVTRVIEIEEGRAEFYSGNYSFYAVEKERRYQERLKRYEKEQAKIQQLEKAAEQLRVWAFMGMDKTYRRAVNIERRIERMRTTAKPTRRQKMDARFSTAEFHGDEVLGIRNVAKSYGDKHLFDGITLKVEGGERIALIGDNGTGKSTLIKMIVGELYPDEGRIKLGPQAKPAYLPQIVRFEHPDWDLVEVMCASKRGLSAQSARNRLAAYDFRGEDVFKPVSVLSGGEQSRLRLCMLMDGEINFLILDEPTNHLDIASREWIEEAVESYDGTLLFVSHDRYFINRFATRIWELAEETITDYPMGFAQYRQMKAQEEAAKAEPPKPAKEKAERPARGNRAQQNARRQLTICERDIAKAEERIAALETDMEAAACDYEELTGLTAEREAAQAELDALYERWEQLSEEAGEA